MHNKIISKILMLFCGVMPLVAAAQNSSLNTFNPYTFYGLGDLDNPGTAAGRSMGGVAIGYRSPFDLNIINPASYSAIPRKSFLFDFGMSGKSDYLKNSTTKTAHNNFNISDIAVLMPIYKGIGFGASISPVSSVGYRTGFVETNKDIIANLGHVKYNYFGEGGVSQFKGGFGVTVVKGLSLGADLIYYHGNISRQYSAIVTPTITDNTYNSVYVNSNEEISKVLFGFGLQYEIIRKPERQLVFGATYQPKATISNKISKEITVSGSTDSIYYNAVRTPLTVPEKLGAGFFYSTPKLGFGADYSYQDWSGAYTIPAVDKVELKQTQTFSIGGQYTPNRMDIRRFLNRWTYRVGFRYTDMYMTRDGHKLGDKAISFGVGVPLRLTGMSELSVGVELGKRGKTDFGLVQDNYFRISIGLTLFGDDYWFVKPKYD